MTKPTQTLNVTLKDGHLDVNQDGNGNQIPHGDDVTIQWQLTGNAASGTFNAMDAPHPGFQWIQAPPVNVFGTASPSGNRIRLSDNNTGDDSAGEWIYQIYATINGTEYGTGSSIKSPTLTSTDPTIQNLTPNW